MVQSKETPITLVGVGDISPNRDNPPSIFRFTRDTFRAADIVFGQMESPLSDRGTPQFTPHSPKRLPARNISALTEEGAGFDIMSFACNHAMDCGEDAFFDTLDALAKNNIAVVGAGKNIVEARKPVILERNGTKIGFLAYLSILFPGLEAEEELPGCAPLRASHYYHTFDFQPGCPPHVVTAVLPEYLKAMEEDIKALRPQVDVLVVSMHAGVHNIRATVAMYQKEAAYAAIDAGADLIWQHHSHILKGAECYKGKAIFYGLGNFALEHTLEISSTRPAGDYEWKEGRLKRYYFRLKQPLGYEKHGFHPEALRTMIAKAYIQDKKIQKVTYIPTYITPNLEPEVLTRADARAQEVFDYMEQISAEEGLEVSFSWDGDEVLISS